MWKYDNREPTAETTDRAPLYLRAQIIREGLKGLEHVEALLHSDARYRSGATRLPVR